MTGAWRGASPPPPPAPPLPLPAAPPLPLPHKPSRLRARALQVKELGAAALTWRLEAENRGLCGETPRPHLTAPLPLASDHWDQRRELITW